MLCTYYFKSILHVFMVLFMCGINLNKNFANQFEKMKIQFVYTMEVLYNYSCIINLHSLGCLKGQVMISVRCEIYKSSLHVSA